MSDRLHPLRISRSGPLRGEITIPGDKSISHRAIMLGSLAIGETRISNLLEGEDVLASAAAMRALGAKIERDGDDWIVHGAGVGSLLQPQTALDMGNSGTSARLLMGVLASHHIKATLTGDASLSRRPMARVIEPLSAMGAQFACSGGNKLPLIISGAAAPVPLEYRLPIPSAQVKSAILLAALNTPGTTRIIEPVPTRDHSERMLRAFGANLFVEENEGERVVSLHGPADLQPLSIDVPGDPSSAAFFVVAALLVEGSELTIRNVGINPTRAGLFEILRQMGGHIEELHPREVGGEAVADLHVQHSPLQGVDVDPALAPSMIDEFPVLFVAAALAKGTTHTSGLEELRVKESDRLSAMAAALTLTGAQVAEREDGLVIEGTGGELLAGGGPVATQLDHRIAMSMAIAGMVSKNGVKLDDIDAVRTSFPDFFQLLESVQR